MKKVLFFLMLVFSLSSCISFPQVAKTIPSGKLESSPGFGYVYGKFTVKTVTLFKDEFLKLVYLNTTTNKKHVITFQKVASTRINSNLRSPPEVLVKLYKLPVGQYIFSSLHWASSSKEVSFNIMGTDTQVTSVLEFLPLQFDIKENQVSYMGDILSLTHAAFDKSFKFKLLDNYENDTKELKAFYPNLKENDTFKIDSLLIDNSVLDKNNSDVVTDAVADTVAEQQSSDKSASTSDTSDKQNDEKKPKDVKILLGLSFSASILNEKLNKNKIDSASSITTIRSAETAAKATGFTGSIEMKAGVELYDQLDIYLNVAWGGSSLNNDTDYNSSAIFQSTTSSDKKTETATDQMYFSSSYYAFDLMARYLPFPKSIVKPYVGLGFGAIIPYSQRAVYQEGKLKDSFTKDSKGGGSASTFEDKQTFDIYESDVIWRMNGDIGIAFKGLGAIFYMGYQPRYYPMGLFGKTKSFIVQSDSKSSPNTNQIYKLTLPHIPMTHSVIIGLDFVF